MKKQFKRSTVVLIALIAAIALSTTAFAAGKWVQAWQDDTLKIKFNSAIQTFTDPDDGSKIVPLIYNGRTFLPVRAIATLAGLGVDYDEATNSVLLTSSGAAPVNTNTTGDKPYKDAQSFNDAAVKAADDVNVSNYNVTAGKYEKSNSNTRRLLLDDFKSLTKYGFDVYEYLADEPSKYSDGTTRDFTFQSVYIYPDSNSYSYPNFTVDDRNKIAGKLYTEMVNAAKANGWVVKDQGSDTSSYDGVAYPKIYLYKDGLYLEINSYLDCVKIYAYTYDAGLN